MASEPNTSSSKKAESAASLSFGVHIYLYLLIAILLLCVAVFMGVGFLVVDRNDPRDWMGYAVCAGPVVFLVVLWRALGRCSAPDLSGFRGLLYITAYMSTGIGGFAMFFAIPSVIAGILGCIVIAVTSRFSADPVFTPRQFRRLVLFFQRHRMYQ